MSFLYEKEVIDYTTVYKILGIKCKITNRKQQIEDFVQKLQEQNNIQNNKNKELQVKIKKLEEYKNVHLYDCIRANMIAQIHMSVFPRFKNINVGKDVVICATGPTLMHYTPIDNAVHIGLNRAYQHKGLKLDYIFCQDGTATKEYIDEIDQLENVIKFYGLNCNNEEYRSGVRIPDYHLNAKNSYRYFYWNPNSKYINPDISYNPILCLSSVSISAIHFALYTNPRKIYLVGFDGTTEPHFNGSKRDDVYLSFAEESTNKTNKSYSEIKDFKNTYYPNTEIIMINPVAVKGIFKEIYTESFKLREEGYNA